MKIDSFRGPFFMKFNKSLKKNKIRMVMVNGLIIFWQKRLHLSIANGIAQSKNGI